ncbi:homoprotocatechuate degradation operon regulator HpaR [Kerstersia sp.]|uniref:homoprotocatechuate degradation operon regulator HpaR n=1 Tax=Kerstersia sp. TaxID=1930783 RepID=UPI003F8F587A
MSIITRPFLTLSLLQAREASMQFFRPSLNRHSLTEQQWRILRTLEQHGDMESHQLADLVCILKPSMTGILNRMERDGLVSKRKAEHDQRRIYVSITENGSNIYQRMTQEVEQNHKRLQQQFGKDKLDQLLALLDELKQVKP